mmetsp:Transcript_4802/g.17466  ORF Transcript_4802/g.17466 Transcript_4802/m.17466 type:complete len:200 (+) Transcript_4802:2164-2763(+)
MSLSLSLLLLSLSLLSLLSLLLVSLALMAELRADDFELPTAAAAAAGLCRDLNRQSSTNLCSSRSVRLSNESMSISISSSSANTVACRFRMIAMIWSVCSPLSFCMFMLKSRFSSNVIALFAETGAFFFADPPPCFEFFASRILVTSLCSISTFRCISKILRSPPGPDAAGLEADAADCALLTAATDERLQDGRSAFSK